MAQPGVETDAQAGVNPQPDGRRRGGDDRHEAACAKSFGPKDVLCRCESCEAHRGQEPGDHRRLGHGQERDDQDACIGLIEPDSPAKSGSTATRVDRRQAAATALLARFGMLFQGGALFDSAQASGRTSPSACARIATKTTAECKEIAVEKLRRVGLTPDDGRSVSGRTVGGHAKARRPRPSDRGRA